MFRFTLVLLVLVSVLGSHVQAAIDGHVFAGNKDCQLKRIAVADPIPLLAPVTKTFLSFRF
jgi:hypothetical protein